MRIFFRRIAMPILSWLNSSLDRINHFIVGYIFKINQKLKVDNIGSFHAKSHDVINKAKEYSERHVFEQKEHDFIYYHYLTKYYTAVFEAFFGTIPPIQIFNESRMALDHIIRAKEEEIKEGSAKNIDKATNHALRGLLDILKLNCVGLKRNIQKEHKKYPSKALGLVSNGDYIKKFVELQNKAETCMFKAKLGENGDTKTEVVNTFIHAFDAHNEWSQFQQENHGEIVAMCAKYHILRAGSFLFVIISGVIACYIWSKVPALIDYLRTLWHPG